MNEFSDLSRISDQNYKTSAEVEWKVEEVRLYSSFGILAGKWWGSKDVQPILVLHGWLGRYHFLKIGNFGKSNSFTDNAGAFDRLIPLLPKHLSFLVIDLPGHGLSSKFQDGLSYHLMDFLHVVDFVVRFYKWEKVSIIGKGAVHI